MSSKLYSKTTWVDEVLAGIATYLLKDDAGDTVYEEASIELATGVITPGTAVTAATMQNIEDGIDDIDDLLVSLQSKFALDPATEITVSGGTLTLTQSVHKVQPESGTADDIDNLAGLSAGQFGVLFPSDNGTDTLTLKHGTGNISCIGGSDIALSEGAVIIYYDGTTYFVIGTSAGGGGGGISNVVEDTTPQLGGDLDLNGHGINFPTTPNITDVLDEDTMASDSDTKLATQQSIKAYIDTQTVKHSLSTAANDFLVGSGSNTFIKKTLAEVLTILGKAAASGLASLDGSSKVVQDPANATATPTASKIPIADGGGKLDGWVSDASDTVKGKVELATTAETNTGTDTGRAVTPDALAGSIHGKGGTQTTCFDYTTNVATGDGKGYIDIPDKFNGMNLVGVQARVITAGTTGTLDIQIYNVTDSADMLSTKLTIDSGETSSSTAATSAVIDTAHDDVATADLLRIDVDAVQTTPPKGLIVTLLFQLP